jgi:outer membrane lipoprotein-sorting protein
MSPILVIALIASSYQTSIQSVLQPELHDASFTARVIKGDQAELAKVNKDFGQAYRFQYTTVKMKEPFKLRLETNVEDTEITFIVNGVHRLVRVPKARIVQREDLTSSPGKRQTALDFGLLVPSLFKSLYSAKFIRLDRATGALVFDITYQHTEDDTSRSRIWVDPERHYIIKREWFNQVGRQLATFLYERPREVNGIWMPTRLTVKNTDDRVAGVTQYDSLRVNTGLSDDLFNTN